MKNSSKKIIGVLLAIVVIVGMMAACAKGETPTETTAPAADKATAENSAETDSTPAEEAVDFASEVTTYTLMSPLYIELPDLSNEELYKKIQEQFGINWDITWVSSSDYTAKFQTVLASGDIPDAIVATNLLDTTLNQSINEEFFADLTGYLGDFSDYPNLQANTTENAFSYVTTPDGKIMGIPRNRANLEMVFYMRKDWMDKAGYAVEDIKTLWDWKDAIVDIANSDPDGNGKDDTLGFAAWGFNFGDGYLTDNMCSAFGGYDGQKDADGGLYYWALTDGWVDYIQFASEMYADGAVSKEFSVLSVSEASDMFNAGLAVSYIRTGTWGWGYENNLKNNLGIEDAEVIALPYLKGIEGHSTAVKTTGVFGAYFINSMLEDYDVQKILNFYEGTCNDEWHTYAFYGMEGRDYEVNDEGVKVATEYGKENENMFKSLQQVTTTIANTEMKLVSTAAPKAFNDKIIAAAKTYLEPEANITVNHFRAIKSDSWSTVWPLYQSTYEENTVRAIVGQMSIEDYRAYIEELRAQDDMKTCWQEFAANDAVLFPGGY